jgi:two-component system NtrC family response regulator
MSEPKPKLLIVEDDAGLQAQLKWAYPDFDVVIAGDRAARCRAALEEPAVVTLDLGLPPDPDGTSEGFATLDEIMALKPDTKVIVASGHGARESALRRSPRGPTISTRSRSISTLGLIVRRAIPAPRGSRRRTAGLPPRRRRQGVLGG